MCARILAAPRHQPPTKETSYQSSRMGHGLAIANTIGSASCAELRKQPKLLNPAGLPHFADALHKSLQIVAGTSASLQPLSFNLFGAPCAPILQMSRRGVWGHPGEEEREARNRSRNLGRSGGRGAGIQVGAGKPRRVVRKRVSSFKTRRAVRSSQWTYTVLISAGLI